jgi:hypothetical protein
MKMQGYVDLSYRPALVGGKTTYYMRVSTTNGDDIGLSGMTIRIRKHRSLWRMYFYRTIAI